MLETDDGSASKDVYNIYTADKSWIYVYEPETKEQSTMLAFVDKPHPKQKAIQSK